MSRDSSAPLHPQLSHAPQTHDASVAFRFAVVDVGWGISRDPSAIPQPIAGPTCADRGEGRRAYASSDGGVDVVKVSRAPLATSRPDPPDDGIVTSSTGTGLEASATVSRDSPAALASASSPAFTGGSVLPSPGQGVYSNTGSSAPQPTSTATDWSLPVGRNPSSLIARLAHALVVASLPRLGCLRPQYVLRDSRFEGDDGGSRGRADGRSARLVGVSGDPSATQLASVSSSPLQTSTPLASVSESSCLGFSGDSTAIPMASHVLGCEVVVFGSSRDSTARPTTRCARAPRIGDFGAGGSRDPPATPHSQYSAAGDDALFMEMVLDVSARVSRDSSATRATETVPIGPRGFSPPAAFPTGPLCVRKFGSSADVVELNSSKVIPDREVLSYPRDGLFA